MAYYTDKIETLKSLFGTQDLVLEPDALTVGDKRYPIVQDVILLNEGDGAQDPHRFSKDIQYTFGAEWREYRGILPEHREEFDRYFDIVNRGLLRGKRVCDLGCGIGRWSYFLKDTCRELVLVDFSEAIFVARENLKEAPNALFFKGDLKQLPFAPDFCDFLFSLGVLHHLPTPCLEEVRALKPYAPRLLIFLYYALDNRPVHFRLLLAGVTLVRKVLCRVRWSFLRKSFSLFGALFIYKPLVLLGAILRPLGLSSLVPLYDFYKDKSLRRIEQDVYDRFFTSIEQRVTRGQIEGLQGEFSRVLVSKELPYWHFLCIR